MQPSYTKTSFLTVPGLQKSSQNRCQNVFKISFVLETLLESPKIRFLKLKRRQDGSPKFHFFFKNRLKILAMTVFGPRCLLEASKSLPRASRDPPKSRPRAFKRHPKAFKKSPCKLQGGFDREGCFMSMPLHFETLPLARHLKDGLASRNVSKQDLGSETIQPDYCFYVYYYHYSFSVH